MGKPRLNSMDSSLLKVPQFRCEFEGCQKYFNKLSRLKYHQNTHLEKVSFEVVMTGEFSRSILLSVKCWVGVATDPDRDGSDFYQ